MSAVPPHARTLAARTRLPIPSSACPSICLVFFFFGTPFAAGVDLDLTLAECLGAEQVRALAAGDEERRRERGGSSVAADGRAGNAGNAGNAGSASSR